MKQVQKFRSCAIMKCPGRRLAWLLASVIGCVFACSPLIGAVANVSIVDYAFSPTSVTINVNDEVTWTWMGNYHSTTSSTGLWDSGVYNTGYVYSHTFTSAGTFPYDCSIHYFSGSVVVRAPNVAPTVTITNPPNGAVLSAPASLTLQATAHDSDGSVTNVQFLRGTTPLGNVATSPYSIPVSGLAAGNYTFSAVATDNGGLKATNSITVQVITPSPITTSSPQRTSPTSFQFYYSADVGLRYLVEQSGDLTTWRGLDTNTAASTSVLFQDNSATANPGFYRVGRLPNL